MKLINFYMVGGRHSHDIAVNMDLVALVKRRSYKIGGEEYHELSFYSAQGLEGRGEPFEVVRFLDKASLNERYEAILEGYNNGT